MKTTIVAVGVMVLLASPAAGADVLDVSQLPAAIQDCVNAGQCLFNPNSAYSRSVPGQVSISSYSYFDQSATTPQLKYLTRYQLLSPSAGSGDLWLSMNAAYSTSEASHSMELYLDGVTPTTSTYGYTGTYDTHVTLGLSNQDLLDGGGYRYVLWNDFTYPDPASTDVVKGDLLVNGSPYIYSCVAAGCGGEVALNLVDLTFTSNGTDLVAGFNPGDNRALLFQDQSFYLESPQNGGFQTTESFYVQPVPLPAAGWLFIGGLVPLLGGIRGGRGHV
ncbi:MAG: hypothetical protein WCC36_10785 [Gammaproteobacteria bacterium]